MGWTIPACVKKTSESYVVSFWSDPEGALQIHWHNSQISGRQFWGDKHHDGHGHDVYCVDDDPGILRLQSGWPAWNIVIVSASPLRDKDIVTVVLFNLVLVGYLSNLL